MASLLGGTLLGLAASILWFSHGRIAGISGISSGALQGVDLAYRIPFLVGLLLTGFVFAPRFSPIVEEHGPWLLVLAGLLVGRGTVLGNGCTSGHGICGLARFSKRSMVAVVSFMVVAFITQSLLSILNGGAI